MIGRVVTERDLEDWLRERERRQLAGAAMVLRGNGSPASVVTAPVGTLYLRADGGTGTTLYVKESGTGTSGWVAK